MKLRKAQQKFATWLAVAALLFSALSPAMASVIFADRPDVLARMMAVTPPSTINAQGDICHSDPSGAVTDDGSHPITHGIVCSFCLAASSVVTIPSAAPMAAVRRAIPILHLPVGRVQQPMANPPATYRSRAPPYFS